MMLDSFRLRPVANMQPYLTLSHSSIRLFDIGSLGLAAMAPSAANNHNVETLSNDYDKDTPIIHRRLRSSPH